jgi:hypothetical protein
VPRRFRAEVAGQVVRQPGLRGEPAHDPPRVGREQPPPVPVANSTLSPWPGLGCLYLLLDQQGHHVRGFVPKTGLDDPEPNPRLGALIRERIMAGA